MNLVNAKSIMSITLGIVVLVVVISILRRSKLIESKIDLDDLLLGDDGKLSKAAAVMMGAFLLTSWGMVYMWLTKTMTETYFNGFLLAWVVPSVTKLIVNRPAPASTSETTVLKSTTSVIPKSE